MTTAHFFSKRKTINAQGRLFELHEPVVMGILNLTPDSFYEESRHYHNVLSVLNKAEEMLSEGALMLDMGAASTRPGAPEVSEQEERKRLMPALMAIKKQFPQAFVSIDTYRASIAKEAAELGADMINDISGGQLDPLMFEIIGQIKLPYVLMHIQGTPQTMQQNPQYDDVVKDIGFYFANKIEQLKAYGVNDIILDPGFGFGKNLEQNYHLLYHTHHFRIFEMPILVGISRKSMIYRFLEIQAEDALNGTTVLNTLALLNGADILRVHDVKQAMETIRMVKKYQQSAKHP